MSPSATTAEHLPISVKLPVQNAHIEPGTVLPKPNTPVYVGTLSETMTETARVQMYLLGILREPTEAAVVQMYSVGAHQQEVTTQTSKVQMHPSDVGEMPTQTSKVWMYSSDVEDMPTQTSKVQMYSMNVCCDDMEAQLNKVYMCSSKAGVGMRESQKSQLEVYSLSVGRDETPVEMNKVLMCDMCVQSDATLEEDLLVRHGATTNLVTPLNESRGNSSSCCQEELSADMISTCQAWVNFNY